MDPATIIVLEGLIFTALFGGLSWLRREGLSTRFAVESLLLTGAAALLIWRAGFSIHPVIFLVVLYLVTFRVRLLVDGANYFARRGQYDRAWDIYRLAGSLWPDQAGRLILRVNEATALMQQGALDEAISSYKQILEQKGHGYLGIKYEAAAHYNLGVAYRRKKLLPQASSEFRTVIDTWPGTVYARQAGLALEQLRKNGSPTKEDR
jgi:tetratricopeptide (TPR) repeat protein